MSHDLTPTEDLVLEVLAARHRLGERLWTFDSRHAPALRRLAARGLVETMHGIVENTIRARLTDAGRAEALSETYVPSRVALLDRAHAGSAPPRLSQADLDLLPSVDVSGIDRIYILAGGPS